MHLDANKKQSSATSGLEVNSCRIDDHVATEIQATTRKDKTDFIIFIPQYL